MRQIPSVFPDSSVCVFAVRAAGEVPQGVTAHSSGVARSCQELETIVPCIPSGGEFSLHLASRL